MELATTIIGYLAPIFTVLLFTPQSYRVWKTKDVSSLSKIAFMVTYTGSFLWLVYGSLTDHYPSAYTTLGTGVMMFPIIHYLFRKDKAGYIFMVSLIVISYIFFFTCVIINSKNPIVIPEWLKVLIVMGGSTITAFAWLPQLIKIIKTKDVKSMSITSVGLIIFSQSLWVIWFALLIVNDTSASLYVSLINSAIPIFIAAAIIGFTLKYGKLNKTIVQKNK